MNAMLVHNLVQQIELKDLSTAAHTWRVVLYTRAIAEAAETPHEQMLMLSHAAALHDVGKLDIPSEILQKPGRLTDEEFEVIKIHPVAGYAHLLEHGVEDETILNLVRYHHERIDGLGYPFGIEGEDIPVEAKYFSVIDAFDAMTSIRPYRDGVGPDAAELALAELHAGAGSRYERDAVELFDRLYRRGDLDHILRHFNDSVPVGAYRSGAVGAN